MDVWHIEMDWCGFAQKQFCAENVKSMKQYRRQPNTKYSWTLKIASSTHQV